MIVMAKMRMSSTERARIFKALSDPRRIDILDLVAKHGSLTGTELANLMGISVALLSHHWDVLADAGLLAKTRVGQARYCRLEMACLGEAVDCWREIIPGAANAAPPPKKKKSAGA